MNIRRHFQINFCLENLIFETSLLTKWYVVVFFPLMKNFENFYSENSTHHLKIYHLTCTQHFFVSQICTFIKKKNVAVCKEEKWIYSLPIFCGCSENFTCKRYYVWNVLIVLKLLLWVKIISYVYDTVGSWVSLSCLFSVKSYFIYFKTAFCQLC